MSLDRDFTVNGTSLFLSPSKHDDYSHTIDFSFHVSTVRNAIDYCIKHEKPKLLLIEGVIGVGKTCLAEVLAKNLHNTIMIDGWANAWKHRPENRLAEPTAFHLVHNPSSTFLIDEARYIESESLSAILDTIAENNGTAILFINTLEDFPGFPTSRMVHLVLTRNGLTANLNYNPE